MKSDKETEIYVHIPFCERKCAYCDFLSFKAGEDVHRAYTESIIKQIDEKRKQVGPIRVSTCFFGGGTPSVIDSRLIVSILDKLKESFDLDEKAEISIEVNPNSASKEKLSEYKKAGFNRLSIGLQSANNDELKILSRLHTYEEFLTAFHAAREAGFDNINIDVMSALPGQTLSAYAETLKKVTALNPEHISAYSLIIEEGTPFFDRYSDGHGLPSEDADREMYHFTKKFLSEHGYSRYEISNYSKPGFECRHNCGYWLRKDYLGFGIGAASLFNHERLKCHENIDRFLNEDYSEEKETLIASDEMSEFMFLGLRLTRGVSKTEFYRLFNKNVYDVYGPQIAKLRNEKLMEDKGGFLFLTDFGLDVSNYAMSEFV